MKIPPILVGEKPQSATSAVTRLLAPASVVGRPARATETRDRPWLRGRRRGGLEIRPLPIHLHCPYTQMRRVRDRWGRTSTPWIGRNTPHTALVLLRDRRVPVLGRRTQKLPPQMRVL